MVKTVCSICEKEVKDLLQHYVIKHNIKNLNHLGNELKLAKKRDDFGKYVDESSIEHEYMIDCIRHPVIHKDESATLNRVVRLYF